MRQPRDWFTSVQDNTLRKMKRMGFTPAEIGEKLGRTEFVIRERARTLGIPWQKDLGRSDLANQYANGFDKDREAEARQRAADERFVYALALAFKRGDHLPTPEPEPVRTRPVPAKRPSLFSIWED
ncbi:MAG: hypothetical protein ACK528_11885 [Alphaproteobacteria bacterium]|jgi:hypothetical protein